MVNQKLMFIYPKSPLFGNNIAIKGKAETWFYHRVKDKNLRVSEEYNRVKINEKVREYKNKSEYWL